MGILAHEKRYAPSDKSHQVQGKINQINKDVLFRKQQKEAYFAVFNYQLTQHQDLQTQEEIILEDVFNSTTKALHLEDIYPSFVTHHQAEKTTFMGDATLLKDILYKAIGFIQSHNKNGQPIQVLIETTELYYKYAEGKNTHPAVRIALTLADSPHRTKEKQFQGLGLLTGTRYIPDTTTLFGQLYQAVEHYYGYVDAQPDSTQKANRKTYVELVLPLKLEGISDGKALAKMYDARKQYLTEGPRHTAEEKQAIAQLKKIADEYEVDEKQLALALELIQTYHAHQVRKTGEKYFLHPIAVACLLKEYVFSEHKLPEQDKLFLAALLHDVVEDTDLPLPFLGACFGQAVMELVHGLTNIDSGLRGVALSKLSTMDRLQEEDRVLYGKLCDRLHNMQTIGAKPLHKQKITAEDTRKFYLTHAERLGLKKLHKELLRLIQAVENQ